MFISEYGQQTKVTSTLLAATTGCNPVIIRNILSALKKAGIVSNPKGIGGTRLALPPEKISLDEIYSAIDPTGMPLFLGLHANPSKSCPVGRNIHAVLRRSYYELETAAIERMRMMCLQDVLNNYHMLLSETK